MKIFAPFRLGNAQAVAAMLALTLACNALFAQKIESQETQQPTHAAKVRSTTLTLTLIPAAPVVLPAAGGSFALANKSITLTSGDLAALPHESVTVINGHTNLSEIYSGVPISALLTRLGLPFERENERTLLKTVLVAEGTDGYRVVLSTYETLASIRNTPALVADALTTPEGNKPLDKDGAFKLIVPGDKRPQRWVQNLKSLTFRTLE